MKGKIFIKKENLRGKLKSKFFVVLLSNEENLIKCLENQMAGFPDTDNGKWAYLDINGGGITYHSTIMGISLIFTK